MSLIFKKVVRNKSNKELLFIAENPDDYQDDFLLALKEELDHRQVELDSLLLNRRLERISNIEASMEKRKRLLNKLPATMVWASNFIYFSIVLNLILIVNRVIHLDVSGATVTWLFPLIGFLLMMFIASVIKKGQDVTKVMVVVIVSSILNLLIKGGLFLKTEDYLAFMLLFLITGFEVIALILLCSSDSRDWYSNEGECF